MIYFFMIVAGVSAFIGFGCLCMVAITGDRMWVLGLLLCMVTVMIAFFCTLASE
jgi:hypothetical protein